MRKLTEITIAGVRVPVAELTASQVDELLEKMEAGFDPSRLDQLMFVQKHIPEYGLDMITAPVKLAELIKEHDLAPSEYVEVYDKAAEINPFLFQALSMYREKQDRIGSLQRAIQAASGAPLST